MMKKLLAFALYLLVAGLAACNEVNNEPPPIPMQHWKDMDVRIETHPNPPLAGMSEVVVIVTGSRGRPVHDLIISLRSSDAAAWVQTIQDGHIGVYRRGVNIGFGEQAVLQVQLQQGGSTQVLFFPLKLSAG
jgi:hypothetical protein